MTAIGLSMTINGGAAPTVGTFGVVNPATADVFAQAPACSRGQLDEAMTAAQTAFRSWRADDKVRRVVLGEMGDALEAAVDRLAPLLTAEQGKPLEDARIEVGGAVAWLRYYADLESPPEIVQDDEHGYVEVVRRPLGVVAAITPWNFPVVLAAWKVAPALRAGNTMVLKPSPFTPMTTLALGEIWREVLPPGGPQRGQRTGLAGRLDDRTPRAAEDQLHRLDGDREEGGGCRCGGSQAGDARIGRQ